MSEGGYYTNAIAWYAVPSQACCSTSMKAWDCVSSSWWYKILFVCVGTLHFISCVRSPQSHSAENYQLDSSYSKQTMDILTPTYISV